MKLTDIHLENYRNYEQLALDFSPNLTIFLGENAQGKTNLLESIYVLAMTRSHRTNNEKEFIRWGEDIARIEGNVQKRNSSVKLEMAISAKGKKTKINHLEQRRLSDYIGFLNVILFAPEDLSLVKGSPQVRRRFIDMELGQVNPNYLYQLSQYQTLLKQRNQYLRRINETKKKDEVFLEVLAEQLAESGSFVLFYRYQFLKKLMHWANEIHETISQQKEDLAICYEPSIKVDESMEREELKAVFLEALKKNQARDLMKQTTSVGPHRDDLLFLVNQQNVQTFGSQGQQRTAALSIKLAEIELMNAEIGEYPILLLDDVLSELDDERQIHLMAAIEGKVQTFLTTTSLAHIEDKMKSKPAIFHVSEGKIERKSE
ncbi:DNA replication/repair protein RecF [Vagococcus entomophilus]|uniref:DNA replication and repair protein RecF n=1 Tax=Vagococcus entomophilus TaxID=1160095 RepID=A0A430AG37_9ENTE|nr:DNA replication/repair protein RecF [Vagococcus entomophilus]RSU06867.1 DNA replication/repair protein RecF [Vagococcus entomophilus]